MDHLALAFGALPGDAPVPSCPGWTVADLGLHVGSVHRWALSLVRTRPSTRVGSSRTVSDPGPPSPDWLRQGGEALVRVLLEADPAAPMWAWGPDHHVRFWSRRQAHETLVHRVDLELAAGTPPSVIPAVAADALDEWLGNLPWAGAFSPNLAGLRGDGEILDVRATDVPDRWAITLEPDGFVVTRGGPAGQATLRGPVAELLLVLTGRRVMAAGTVELTGDRDLGERWLRESGLG